MCAHVSTTCLHKVIVHTRNVSLWERSMVYIPHYCPTSTSRPDVDLFPRPWLALSCLRLEDDSKTSAKKKKKLGTRPAAPFFTHQCLCVQRMASKVTPSSSRQLCVDVNEQIMKSDTGSSVCICCKTQGLICVPKMILNHAYSTARRNKLTPQCYGIPHMKAYQN